MSIFKVNNFSESSAGLALRPIELNPVGYSGDVFRLPCVLHGLKHLTIDTNNLFLSYHIFSEHENIILFEGNRSPLPPQAHTNNTSKCFVDIQLPNKFGNFLVQPTLVKESEYWLEDRGLTSWIISLKVLEPILRLDAYSESIKNRLSSFYNEVQ